MACGNGGGCCCNWCWPHWYWVAFALPAPLLVFIAHPLPCVCIACPCPCVHVAHPLVGIIDSGDTVVMGGHAVACVAGNRGGWPSGALSWAVGDGWVCSGPLWALVLRWLG